MRIGLKMVIAFSVLALPACDDEEHADLLGGGQGSSDLNNVIAGDGFCGPQGGREALGSASFDSGVTTAKIDTDGNPLMGGHDATWQADTSGHVNGQAVNSVQYAYVVMSISQINASGVALGDWATVTNAATGKTVFARVEDKGPPGGTGEISQAAASAVGIQYLPSSATVGDPSVIVEAYAGTSSIQGDCSQSVATNS
jgi:hypothetical protein